MPTSTNEKRVFWFDDHKTPNVADALAHAADFVVHRLAFKAPEAENWAVMAHCHAYCAMYLTKNNFIFIPEILKYVFHVVNQMRPAFISIQLYPLVFYKAP